MSPLQKLLESGVGQDCFNRVECIPKLVMSPSLVNIGLTGFTGGHYVRAALRFWNDVVPTG
jgi:hypothetical protein